LRTVDDGDGSFSRIKSRPGDEPIEPVLQNYRRHPPQYHRPARPTDQILVFCVRLFGGTGFYEDASAFGDKRLPMSRGQNFLRAVGDCSQLALYNFNFRAAGAIDDISDLLFTAVGVPTHVSPPLNNKSLKSVPARGGITIFTLIPIRLRRAVALQ